MTDSQPFPPRPGAYGVVYKARHIDTGAIVSLKKIRLDAGDEGVPSTAIREISLLKELKDENIVKQVCPLKSITFSCSSSCTRRFLEIVHADQKLYLVFEFLDMDLKRYLDEGNKNGTPITMDKVKVRITTLLFVPPKRHVA